MSKRKLSTKVTSRKVLTLEDRIKVIERCEAGGSSRQVGDEFGCGRSQIQTIMKQKDEILQKWHEGMNADVKYLVPRNLVYADVDEHVFGFFNRARSKNMPITGPMLKEEALSFASQNGHDNFQASEGWLSAFLKRHKIKFVALCGEAAEVPEGVVDDFKARLPLLLQGYKPEDIYNCDESGLYFRGIPTKSFIKSGDSCSGVKVLKERITVLFTVSSVGEKMKLLVIGKSNNPRSFKNHQKHHLPVVYKANSKAWMTSSIFVEYLQSLNNRMRIQNRNILLLMDNCPSHPDINLSNIKISFLPKNTTSKLQPLDAGIIQMTKTNYRKLMMREIRLAIEECDTVSDVAKKVTVLDAIINLSIAWNRVPAESIKRCFYKCGFPDLDVTPETEVQPEDCTELFQDILEVPWQEFVQMDENIATESSEQCSEVSTDKCTASTDESLDQDPVEIEEPITLEEAAKMMKRIRNVCLNNETMMKHATTLQHYLEQESIEQKLKQMKQTKIQDFFKKC